MSKQHFASDWITIREGLQYSKEQNLYWFNGRVYDERSAQHNGIIGLGFQFRETIKQHKE